MTDNTDRQASGLAGLIKQTPYQSEASLGAVTPTPSVPGVHPAGDSVGQGPADEGLSPAPGHVAGTGQVSPQGPGVTPGQPQQAAPNGESPSASDLAAENKRLLETVQQQSALVNETTTALQRWQHQQAVQAAQTRERTANAQFMQSISQLPEDEQRVKIAERRAWIATQRARGLEMQAGQAEQERQQQAKRFVAIDECATVGISPVFADALLMANNPQEMRMKAEAIKADLQAGGYGAVATQAAGTQQVQQQGQNWTQGFPTQQVQATQELPNPAFAGVGGAPSPTIIEKPAHGSGNLLGLIQATPYTQSNR